MSQYFRKLKAKWKDPRCRGLGSGRIFLGASDTVGLKCVRMDVHVNNCKCKKERRDRRWAARERRFHVPIAIDEFHDPKALAGLKAWLGVDVAYGSSYTVHRKL